MATKKCDVCGSEHGPWTREHVYPDWLLKLLSQRHERMEVAQLLREGGDVSADLFAGQVDYEVLRAHPAAGLRVGSVCQRCNAGWMSALECEVIPILPWLAEALRMPFELTRNERFVLARWSLKTALMFERATPEIPHSPASDKWLALLAEGSFPSTVAVYAGVGPRGGIGAVQGDPFFIKDWSTFSNPPVFDDSGEGYKTGLRIDGLYIAIVEMPLHPYVHLIWADMHTPIWPPNALVARFRLSPGYFAIMAPNHALHMYVDSLSLAPAQDVLRERTAWAGGTASPPALLTPQQAQEARRLAIGGPFVR